MSLLFPEINKKRTLENVSSFFKKDLPKLLLMSGRNLTDLSSLNYLQLLVVQISGMLMKINLLMVLMLKLWLKLFTMQSIIVLTILKLS